MNDRNGKELKVGDIVTVETTVKELIIDIATGAETVKVEIGELPVPPLVINPGQVVKIYDAPAEPPSEQ